MIAEVSLSQGISYSLLMMGELDGLFNVVVSDGRVDISLTPRAQGMIGDETTGDPDTDTRMFLKQYGSSVARWSVDRGGGQDDWLQAFRDALDQAKHEA